MRTLPRCPAAPLPRCPAAPLPSTPKGAPAVYCHGAPFTDGRLRRVADTCLSGREDRGAWPGSVAVRWLPNSGGEGGSWSWLLESGCRRRLRMVLPAGSRSHTIWSIASRGGRPSRRSVGRRSALEAEVGPAVAPGQRDNSGWLLGSRGKALKSWYASPVVSRETSPRCRLGALDGDAPVPAASEVRTGLGRECGRGRCRCGAPGSLFVRPRELSAWAQ